MGASLIAPPSNATELPGASASYIAVPAAMRMAVPEANPSIYLTPSLGVTFPFNILPGIPLCFWVAARLAFEVTA